MKARSRPQYRRIRREALRFALARKLLSRLLHIAGTTALFVSVLFATALVAPAVAANTAPTVSIDDPAHNSEDTDGRLNVEVSASDAEDGSAAKLRLYINNSLVSERFNKTQYTWWGVNHAGVLTALANGDYILRAEAEDSEGLLSTTQITVTVDYDYAYFVSPDGDDGNDGTSSNFPFQTLAEAVQNVQPGDAVLVMNGTYLERLDVPTNSSGTELNPITFVSEENVILDGPNNYVDGPRQNIRIKGDHIVVIGFECREAGNSSFSTVGVQVHSNAAHVILRHLFVHDAWSHGILIQGDDVIVSDCIVSNNVLENENEAAGQWGSGLKVAVEANTVTARRNLVIENWGEGIAFTRVLTGSITESLSVDNYGCNIYVDNSVDINVIGNFCYASAIPRVIRDGKRATGISTAEEPYAGWGNQLEDIYVVNNIVSGGYRGLAFGGTHVGTGGIRNSVFAHNTVYDIDSAALWIHDDPLTSLEVKNNIFHMSNDDNDISMILNTNGVTMDYNVWSEERSGFDRNRVPTGSHSVEGVDPGFLSTPGFRVSSFKLSSGSTARDRGADLGVSEDLEKNSRNDGQPDCGALEQGGTSAWFDACFGLELLGDTNPPTAPRGLNVTPGH